MARDERERKGEKFILAILSQGELCKKNKNTANCCTISDIVTGSGNFYFFLSCVKLYYKSNIEREKGFYAVSR